MLVHNCMDTGVVSFTGSKVTRFWENGKIGKLEGSVCSDWDVALEILVEALVIAQGTSAAEAHEFLIRLVISSSSFDSFIFHNNIILRVSVIFHEDCTGDQELKRWHKAILVSWMRGKLLLSSVRIFLEWFEQRKKCKLFSDKETRSQVRVLLKWNSSLLGSQTGEWVRSHYSCTDDSVTVTSPNKPSESAWGLEESKPGALCTLQAAAQFLFPSFSNHCSLHL